MSNTRGMNAKGAVNKMRELSKKGKTGQKVRVKRKKEEINDSYNKVQIF